MLQYAWSGPEDPRACGEVLDDLETAEMPMGEWRFFIWNDENGDEYDVVGWVGPGETFPASFDEDAEKKAFFKLLNMELRIGV
ncbi:MAG: hypothetical protein ABFD52_09340 [Acidobacteriota bacterium]